MPKVEIKQSHKVTAEEAKKRIDTLKSELSDKYGLNSKWLSDTEAKVERTGATGTITIKPDHIDVHLDLSFALTPLKGKIESKIKDELEKLFKV